MRVRDAVEADAEALAAVGDAPTEVMRNLVHDRTVRVAVRSAGDPGPHADAPVEGGSGPGTDRDGEEVVGFVSFDARNRTVHVTQLGGSVQVCERLLAEPIRFAAGEGMEVELLVGVDEEEIRAAAERVGFAEDGAGPTFDGRETVRYRFEPD
ncbi:MAG: hypothetical protein ABEJ81_01455 [Haloferacaceae archaeon]